MAHAVDHMLVFEIDTEFAVIPAGNRRVTDAGVLLVGQAEAFEYLALRFAELGQRELVCALLADGDLQDLCGCGQGQQAE
jgi:hypothetical protein